MSLQQLRAAEILIAIWGVLFATGFSALLLIAFFGESVLNLFFWG